jgi:hypothetical protein
MLSQLKQHDIEAILRSEKLDGHSTVSALGVHVVVDKVEIYAHLKYGQPCVEVSTPNGNLAIQDALVRAESLVRAARIAARIQAVVL